VLKLLVPAAAVLVGLWFVNIPKEWLPGKNARQLREEKEKAEAAKAEAARKAIEAVAVRRFDDPEGVYSVEFRGKPDLMTLNSNKLFQWMSVAGYSHHRTVDGIRYDSRYERWEPTGKTTRAKLEYMRPKLLTGPGLPAPQVKEVTSANGVPGIEAAGVYEDRPRKFKMTRVFLVPEQPGIDRYYSATVTGPADWLPSPEAEAFLGSFELTDKALLYPLPGAPGK
jgi:hypothetical protein